MSNHPDNVFEARAERVLKYLNVDHRYGESYLPRPFFVEFTGSPDSGKTTTIDELYKFFKTLKFRVLRPQEGAEVIQHVPRSTPLYNIRTAQYAVNQLIGINGREGALIRKHKNRSRRFYSNGISIESSPVKALRTFLAPCLANSFSTSGS